MASAQFWIRKLGLQKHPEGGWFKEVYRSDEKLQAQSLPAAFPGGRNFSTSIYYLLEGSDFSAFHRIRSDELWHFYAGTSAVEILWIKAGELLRTKVGPDIENNEQFQVVIPKNHWFAARLADARGYALAGCTVSPGFHFEDFEMADSRLLSAYPHLGEELQPLLRL